MGLEKDDPVLMIKDKRPGFELDYLHRPHEGLAADMGVTGGKSAMYEHKDLANMITARAVKWLNNAPKDKPWFLYLAHRNIHGPMIPDPRYKGKSAIGRRGDFLMEFDDSIGKILKTLENNGLKENTLVIFSSDNGGVHKYTPIDYVEDNGHKLNGVLRGQKTGVYEGGHRVPMMARWPGHIKPGTTCNEMIALTDVLATFADFFETDIPENSAEDSFSFLGPMFDRKDRQVRRTSMVNDSFTGLLSMRRGPWKYIDGQGGGGAKEPEEVNPDLPAGQLYNLEEDIRESKNLYKEKPELVKELKALLEHSKKDGRTAPVKR